MSWNNKEIQVNNLLTSLFGCNSEEVDYLIHIINKAQSKYKYDILESVISGLHLNCSSRNFRRVSDELFCILGAEILNEMVHEKMSEGGRCIMSFTGANVKDKTYIFDTSIIQSNSISDTSKLEIVNEFNNFLEKNKT